MTFVRRKPSRDRQRDEQHVAAEDRDEEDPDRMRRADGGRKALARPAGAGSSSGAPDGAALRAARARPEATARCDAGVPTWAMSASPPRVVYPSSTAG